MRASMVYVPTLKKRANISFLRDQLPTYQRRAHFSTCHASEPKALYQLFFNRKFVLIFKLWLTFANFKNI